MADEPVRLTLRDGVATLTLDRPQASNALDLPMAQALMRMAIRCDEDRAVRVVVLTGAGARFCVGGDVKSFLAAGTGAGALIKELTGCLHVALLRFAHMDAPLVTAVRGVAAGAGMSLALAGDLVFVGSSAMLVPAYVRAGLSPDCGLSHRLPKLVGLREAQRILLLNTALDAEASRVLGLVTEVAPDEELDARVAEAASRLAAGPREAIAAVRRLLLAAPLATLESQLETESRTIAHLAGTPDGQEGMRAVMEKRAPAFG